MTSPLYEDRPGNGPGDDEDDEEDEEQPARLTINQQAWRDMWTRWAEGITAQLGWKEYWDSQDMSEFQRLYDEPPAKQAEE